ncbi:MAG: NAD(P)-binding protein [bacterium]|nr:NAD(P)-binding protein [bacterium]
MILIIGGGLAGMSTAYHLGDREHLVLEAEAEPGGLCRSREIDGFVFDYTGHLLHLRDERIMRLVDEWLPGTFAEVERKANIRSRGATLPFPFQANLYGLPVDVVKDCLVGFAESLGVALPDDPATSFEEWSLAVFGRGISDAFMLSYNEKLFCRDPKEMTADWVSWAVPKPNLEEVVRGALGIENRGMGYNSKFRYPVDGGIGVLPAALAERVEHMRRGVRVVEVDLDARTATLDDGERLSYDELVVTTPLPGFLDMVRGGAADYASLARRLDWSVVACLNLGVDRAGIADGAHWTYFPDPEVPFYRAGFPSNFSTTVAREGTSSMYVEFGVRRGAAFDSERAAAHATDALHREGILEPGDRILVSDWIRIDPGYVIFDRDRQEVMEQVVPDLKSRGVHLIGRYGAWTYSYMERALLDGLELAESLR